MGMGHTVRPLCLVFYTLYWTKARPTMFPASTPTRRRLSPRSTQPEVNPAAQYSPVRDKTCDPKSPDEPSDAKQSLSSLDDFPTSRSCPRTATQTAHHPAPRRRSRSTQERAWTARRAAQAAPARTTKTSCRGLFPRTRTPPYSIPDTSQPRTTSQQYFSAPRRLRPTRQAARAPPARTTRPTRRGALSRTRTLPYDIPNPSQPRATSQQHKPPDFPSPTPRSRR